MLGIALGVQVVAHNLESVQCLFHAGQQQLAGFQGCLPQRSTHFFHLISNLFRHGFQSLHDPMPHRHPVLDRQIAGGYGLGGFIKSHVKGWHRRCSLLRRLLFLRGGGAEAVRQTGQIIHYGFLSTWTTRHLLFTPKNRRPIIVKSVKYDAIVIGAGVAGLAAARKLQENGKKVAVLEARDRIGGRVETDQTTFSRPFDLGAHWFHQEEQEQNPLANWARQQGVEQQRDRTQYDSQPFVEQQHRQAELWAKSKGDRPLSELPAVKGPWAAEARNMLGPLSVGVELSQASSKDFRIMMDEKADLVAPGGMAQVVHKLAQGLDVRLNTTVSLIEWSGQGCWVTAGSQKLEADQVVVTLPVGVLQKEVVKFRPALPAWKNKAIHSLQMGHLKKIAFEFPPGQLTAPTDTGLQVQGSPMFHLVRPEGSDMSVTLVGGQTAQDWEKLGPEAAQQKVLQELRSVYGPQLSPAAGTVTHWESDPLSGGSYSAAKPGHQSARAELAKPLAGRLFFAGEACQEEWATTAAGAFLSGEKAAQDILISNS